MESSTLSIDRVRMVRAGSGAIQCPAYHARPSFVGGTTYAQAKEHEILLPVDQEAIAGTDVHPS